MDLDLNHIYLNLSSFDCLQFHQYPICFSLPMSNYHTPITSVIFGVHFVFSISFCWLPLQTFSFVHCQCESIVSYFPSLSSLIFHRQCESYCLILFLFFPFFIANVKVSHSTFTLFRSFIFHRQCERFFFFFHFCSFIFHGQCDSIF